MTSKLTLTPNIQSAREIRSREIGEFKVTFFDEVMSFDIVEYAYVAILCGNKSNIPILCFTSEKIPPLSESCSGAWASNRTRTPKAAEDRDRIFSACSRRIATATMVRQTIETVQNLGGRSSAGRGVAPQNRHLDDMPVLFSPQVLDGLSAGLRTSRRSFSPN